jgi:hypothetical protein
MGIWLCVHNPVRTVKKPFEAIQCVTEPHREITDLRERVAVSGSSTDQGGGKSWRVWDAAALWFEQFPCWNTLPLDVRSQALDFTACGFNTTLEARIVVMNVWRIVAIHTHNAKLANASLICLPWGREGAGSTAMLLARRLSILRLVGRDHRHCVRFM